LGGVIFVSAEDHFADAVGAGFKGQVGNGGFGAQGAAGEMFAGGAAVREDGATAQEEGEHRTSNAEHPTSRSSPAGFLGIEDGGEEAVITGTDAALAGGGFWGMGQGALNRR